MSTVRTGFSMYPLLCNMFSFLAWSKPDDKCICTRILDRTTQISYLPIYPTILELELLNLCCLLSVYSVYIYFSDVGKN